MCSTIFQVSAVGTCLGCLLVGLSFLAKVWCDFILIIRLTTSHSSEQCHFFLHGTGTSLGKGPELSAGFGRHSGTLLFRSCARAHTHTVVLTIFIICTPDFRWIIFTGYGRNTLGYNVRGTFTAISNGKRILPFKPKN